MKRFALYSCLLLISCNARQNSILKSEHKKWGSDHWSQDFKDKVLCDCLISGIHDKNFSSTWRSSDKSFSSPVNYILFDSLSKEILKPVILKMKADSVESLDRVSEGSAGKQVFRECLEFYKSGKLDSITKSEAKKWKKVKHIDTLISMKVPTY